MSTYLILIMWSLVHMRQQCMQLLQLLLQDLYYLEMLALLFDLWTKKGIGVNWRDKGGELEPDVWRKLDISRVPPHLIMLNIRSLANNLPCEFLCSGTNKLFLISNIHHQTYNRCNKFSWIRWKLLNHCYIIRHFTAL